MLLGFGLETTLFGAYESMLSEAPAGAGGRGRRDRRDLVPARRGIGIALLGSVMNAAYAPGRAPSVRRGARRRPSAAASHSLGEAYEVAAQLGGTAGAALRPRPGTPSCTGCM